MPREPDLELRLPTPDRRASRTLPCIAIDYSGFGLSEPSANYGYTPGAHAAVVGELVVEVAHLSGMFVMGHDWGSKVMSSWPLQRAILIIERFA